jgi:imidazolonepropionase-like amidohydrolase
MRQLSWIWALVASWVLSGSAWAQLEPRPQGPRPAAPPGVAGPAANAPVPPIVRQRALGPRWVLTNVNVVDVATGAVASGVNITLGGDEILTISKNKPAPEEPVVEGHGRFVIPGLFDLHAHIPGDIHRHAPGQHGSATAAPRGVPGGPPPSGRGPPPSGPGTQQQSIEDVMKTLLRHGVTTIRAMPLFSQAGPLTAAQVNAGDLIGPHVVPVSTLFEKKAFRSSFAFGDPATAARWVEKEALNGVRWIKIYNSMDAESLTAIVSAARRHGLKVCGHTLGVPPREASNLGIASIEHYSEIPLSCLKEGATLSSPGPSPAPPQGAAAEAPRKPFNLAARVAERWDKADAKRCEELLKLFVKNGTAWVPTLVVTEGILQRGQHDDGPVLTAEDKAGLERASQQGARLAVALHRMGGLVGVGTDFPIDGTPVGTSVHREIELLVTRGGATPLEALQMATRSSARILGLDAWAGTVEPGKLASLVILEGNPLEDIANIRRVTGVVHAGHFYEPGQLATPAAEGARGPPAK